MGAWGGGSLGEVGALGGGAGGRLHGVGLVGGCMGVGLEGGCMGVGLVGGGSCIRRCGQFISARHYGSLVPRPFTPPEVNILNSRYFLQSMQF